MYKFTQAYKKLRKVVLSQRYQGEWEELMRTSGALQRLLGEDKLNFLQSGILDDIRGKIRKADAAKRTQVMLDACKSGDNKGTVAERAAALKMLSHIYEDMERGGQTVWIYSPPKAYKKWVFDEIKGPDDAKIKVSLGETDEVYSFSDRQLMVNALAVARKWSMDAQVKLVAGDAATKTMVRRWFADEKTNDAQLTAIVAKLLAGFKKIANKANSTHLIFSDDPIDRRKIYNKKTGEVGWAANAFVYPEESMDVLYIQGGFLDNAASGRLWRCAVTIVHELSHREANTDDIRYGKLTPHHKRFPSAMALRNAANWGFFPADLAGALADADRSDVMI